MQKYKFKPLRYHFVNITENNEYTPIYQKFIYNENICWIAVSCNSTTFSM